MSTIFEVKNTINSQSTSLGHPNLSPSPTLILHHSGSPPPAEKQSIPTHKHGLIQTNRITQLIMQTLSSLKQDIHRSTCKRTTRQRRTRPCADPSLRPRRRPSPPPSSLLTNSNGSVFFKSIFDSLHICFVYVLYIDFNLYIYFLRFLSVYFMKGGGARWHRTCYAIARCAPGRLSQAVTDMGISIQGSRSWS